MKNIVRITGQKIRNLFSRSFSSKKKEKKTVEENKSVVVVEDHIIEKKIRKTTEHKRPPAWSLDSFIVPEEPGKKRFHDFEIPLPVMHAVADLGFQYCTQIQEKALPEGLVGKDIVGKANTGTGKTAVFLITVLTRLQKGKGRRPGEVLALVLAPTRELVIQIGKDARALGKYSNFAVRTVFGGTDYQKQFELLREKPCDLLIATPGRLLDFLGKGVVRLDKAEILVLDEADRMLDMGFIPDVRRIVGRMPTKDIRQTMLFSATVTEDVRRLSYQWCTKPVEIDAEPEQVAADKVEQKFYLVSGEEKYTVLYNLIISHPDARTMVFTNMKEEARRLSERLQRNGVDCVLLSGDVAQKKRTARLERFREGGVKVLVATDVAGRGIHIDDIRLVVNYTLPYEAEDYIHRIGRTGRAGASGFAVSFACEEGSFYLPAIEELLKEQIQCILPEEELLQPVPPSVRKNNLQEGKKEEQRVFRPRNRRKRRISSGDSRSKNNFKKEPKNSEKS